MQQCTELTLFHCSLSKRYNIFHRRQPENRFYHFMNKINSQTYIYKGERVWIPPQNGFKNFRKYNLL